MANGFDVDLQALGAHKGEVQECARSLKSAQEAGDITRTDNGAFGVFCQFLVPYVDVIQDATAGVIAQAVDTLDSTVTGLEGVIRSYRSVDDKVQGAFQSLLKELS